MITNEDYIKYEPMIYKIANKFKNNIYKLEIEDLIQICAIGLIRGFNTYDDTKDCKKDTWIYSCIKRAILREFHNLNRIKRQSLINSISIDTPIGGLDEDITIADTIEDVNVNTSNEAIDKVIIDLYKAEVDAILSGMEHFIAHEILFTDKTLIEVSASKEIEYSKAKRIQDKAFRELKLKSRLIRNKYMELKEKEAENDIINLYKNPAKIIYMHEISKDLRDKYKYELDVIDTMQTIFDGLDTYKKNEFIQGFILSLDDILEAKDLFIYKAILEGNRVSLSEKYSFNDICFVEDRIKKQVSYNKEYVYELWKSYEVKSTITMKKNENIIENKLYKSEYHSAISKQISLFS